MNGSRVKGIAILGVLALAVAVSAWAGEKAKTASDTPRYDARAEYVVKATVAGVKTHASLMGYEDTHVVVTTTVGEMEVHVGPTAYLAKHGFEMKPGDEVVVTGCKTTYEDRPVLVARQIQRGDRTVKLRNMTGKPAWPRNLQS
jgi:hypothetical protein